MQQGYVLSGRCVEVFFFCAHVCVRSVLSHKSAKVGNMTENSSKAPHSSVGRHPSHKADPLQESLRDPLVSHPRVSSVVTCAVLGVVFLVLSGLTWWLTARTVTGQEMDDIALQTFHHIAPRWVNTGAIVTLKLSLWASAVLCIIAAAIAFVRKRWEVIAQGVVFGLLCFVAVKLLKPFLPRPTLIHSVLNSHNSAPSGHTTAMMASCVILLMAVPSFWRAIVAVVGVILSSGVGLAVVEQMWHRPSDVLTAILLTAGLAALTLAFTRSSGMDPVGARKSSATVQIIGTVLITVGVCACGYALYLGQQVSSAVGTYAAWTMHPMTGSWVIGICGSLGVCFGVLCALRQVTASPLSAIGLVGAPPKPVQSYSA
jgi:membrane-associated phospholipid phosphatase